MKRIPPLTEDQFHALQEAIEADIKKMEKRQEFKADQLEELSEEIDKMTSNRSEHSTEEIQTKVNHKRKTRSEWREAKDRKFGLKDVLKKMEHAEDVDYDEVREEVQFR